MAMYSIEDKSFIQYFVSANSLDVFSKESEEKWQELGSLMNRDWEEIRRFYQSWRIGINQSESAKEPTDQNEQQNLNFTIDEFIPSNESSTCDVIEYAIANNGELVKTNHLQYTVNAPLQVFASQIDSTVKSELGKRPRDELEFEANADLVKIFENQSLAELELKRKEHEEKMMIYRQQLIHGAELHKERMKILRAKLKAIEEKVENIDNIICSKNLKKKFKSGPI